MEIKQVTYQKLFTIGAYLNERIGVDISVDKGEDPKDVLSYAKDLVETFHKEANPYLYENTNSNSSMLDFLTKEDAETNRKFKALKSQLINLEYYEDAKAILEISEFKFNTELKNIVNSKPQTIA